MEIHAINRVPFQARIKVSAEGLMAPLVSSSTGVSTGGTLSGTASGLAGSGLNTLGTAFSAKASGAASSGIVPMYMEHAASTLTPSALEATNAHPSAAGSFFTVLGDLLTGGAGSSVKVKNVDPS